MSKSQKVKIYLYKRHDIDLITLYKDSEFDFLNAMKTAARAFINNEPVFFERPAFKGVYNFKNSYQANLFLDEVKDADIIAYINNSKDGLGYGNKNTFFKMCLRGCVIGAMPYSLFKSSANANGYEEALADILSQDVKFMDMTKVSKKKKSKENKKTAPLNNIQTSKAKELAEAPAPDKEDATNAVENTISKEQSVTKEKEVSIQTERDKKNQTIESKNEQSVRPNNSQQATVNSLTDTTVAQNASVVESDMNSTNVSIQEQTARINNVANVEREAASEPEIIIDEPMDDIGEVIEDDDDDFDIFAMTTNMMNGM